MSLADGAAWEREHDPWYTGVWTADQWAERFVCRVCHRSCCESFANNLNCPSCGGALDEKNPQRVSCI